MTGGVVVRPAVRGDLKAVADIYAHYVHHTVVTFDETARSVAEWEEQFGDITARGLPFLVAGGSGAVVGFAYARPWRTRPAYRYTVEDSVYLAPDATGRGLGSALLGPLITEAARAGRHRMVAVIADGGGAACADSGTASVALHRRFGFTDAGRLTAVGRKHGRWVDTVLMQRPLEPPDAA